MIFGWRIRSMARKRHTAEEIVAKLRQVDVLMAQGRQVADAVRAIGVTEVTYYRWRNEYGGLKGDQVKRLKELETENSRLRRAVSDLTLDKLILAEAAKGNFFSIRGTWRKSFFENPHCRRSSCEALASLRGQRLAAS
jgi:putative transposase